MTRVTREEWAARKAAQALQADSPARTPTPRTLQRRARAARGQDKAGGFPPAVTRNIFLAQWGRVRDGKASVPEALEALNVSRSSFWRYARKHAPDERPAVADRLKREADRHPEVIAEDVFLDVWSRVVSGLSVDDGSRELGVSKYTFYRYAKRYGSKADRSVVSARMLKEGAGRAAARKRGEREAEIVAARARLGPTGES